MSVEQRGVLVPNAQTRLAGLRPAPAGSAPAGLDPADESKLREFAERLGPERLLELAERCVEADFHVERRVQLMLVIESVLEQFTRPAVGGVGGAAAKPV